MLCAWASSCQLYHNPRNYGFLHTERDNEGLNFVTQQKWSLSKCIAVIIPIVGVMAGLEGALIVGLRIAKDRGIIWPTKMMAVLSAGLLGAGVLRHYWDIYRHRTVRGISFFFVGIDAAGDLFSIVSVRKCSGHFYVPIPAEVVRRLTGLSSLCPST